MDSALLRRVGEALYGPRWQAEMARELQIADRTVRRWISGDTEIGSGVHAELLKLVRERGEALKAVEREMRIRPPPPG